MLSSKDIAWHGERCCPRSLQGLCRAPGSTRCCVLVPRLRPAWLPCSLSVAFLSPGSVLLSDSSVPSQCLALALFCCCIHILLFLMFCRPLSAYVSVLLSFCCFAVFSSFSQGLRNLAFVAYKLLKVSGL